MGMFNRSDTYGWIRGKKPFTSVSHELTLAIDLLNGKPVNGLATKSSAFVLTSSYRRLVRKHMSVEKPMP